MDNLSKAKEIIEKNIYCTIATSTPDGKPWVSPVFFAFDNNYNVYWVSDKNALHSNLIRENPQVAIVFFDTNAPEGAGTAVYMEATARELEKNEVDVGIQIFNSRATDEDFKIKSTEHVLGERVWRICKATHSSVSVLGSGEYINGQYVDKRINVNL